jgi:hypothetical protein
LASAQASCACAVISLATCCSPSSRSHSASALGGWDCREAFRGHSGNRTGGHRRPRGHRPH